MASTLSFLTKHFKTITNPNVSSIVFTWPERGPSLGFETFFFRFFSCCDLAIIEFFGKLRCAIKLVLNSPTAS